MNGDARIRLAAFARVRELEATHRDAIPWSEIARGFFLDGEHFLLSGKARGIFRPERMSRGVLSIKTTMPRAGRQRRYNDIASTPFYSTRCNASTASPDGSSRFLRPMELSRSRKPDMFLTKRPGRGEVKCFLPIYNVSGSRDWKMITNAETTVRVGGLTSATIRELRAAFPELEQHATVEPEEVPVTEDRELGTLVLVLTLTAASLQCATAVLNFLARPKAAKSKNKRRDRSKVD